MTAAVVVVVGLSSLPQAAGGGTAAAAAAGLVPPRAAAQPKAEPTEAAPPPLSGSPEAAAEKARRTGEPVEVLAERTETSTTMANPDGTFMLSMSLEPQRVRRADGGWTPLDLRLQRRSDGTIAPAAGTADVVFSGGGDRPLATFRDGARSLQLSWPGGNLPVPVVDGDTATYSAVLPDVDLRVTATTSGFRDVLVVKTPEAARNPALASLRFATRTTGLTVRAGDGNGVDVLDASGERVFHAGSPQMWDSAGTAVPAAPASSTRRAARGVRATRTARAPRTGRARAAAVPDGAGSDPADAPQQGAHRADIETRVAADSLTLVPDQTMLTSAATKFPIYIDPDFTRGRTGYAYIDKSNPTTSYWNTHEDPRAGKDPDYGVTIRSMFAMNTRPLPKGAYVDKAIFTITGTWTPQWSCSVKMPVELWQTDGINGNETWNNFSGDSHWTAKQDSMSVALGHDGCGPRELEFNALGAVRKAAAGGWNVTTFGLRAPEKSESDTDYWKRFKLDPKLSVTFNRRPNVPSQLKVESKTCASNAWPAIGKLSGRAAPWVQATVTDPDHDELKRTEYEWGTYDRQSKTMKRLGGVFDEANHKNGGTSKLQVPPGTGGLADGTYYYRARAYDGWAAAEQGVGNWSHPCYFTVDQTVPDETVVIAPAKNPDGTDPVYTEDTWAGGIGIPGTFQITTPVVGGSNDVARYKWSLGSDQPATPVAAGNDADRAATITVRPSSFGPVVLYVKGEDATGNPTSLASYTFNVKPPDCANGTNLCAEMAAGYWKLDEGSSTRSQDVSGHGRPLVFGSGTSWADGRLGKAVRFNGTSGCGTTQAGVTSCNDDGGTKVPVIRTDQSFTVSAWVRLRTLAARNMVLVAQGGTHNSAFALYYRYVDATTQHWGFIMTRPDATSSTPGYEARRALSTADSAPMVGEWTHLTGVYDARSGELSIYVNGVDATDSDVDQPNGFHETWNATGSLQVGRTFYNDAYTNWVDGWMQDVHVYPGVLDDRQINDEADPDVRS